MQVSELSEWWHGQKNIVLMDPNLLACKDHMDLIGQLAESKARVDINQGLDARLLTEENVAELKKLRLKDIHFAWDRLEDSAKVLRGLRLWKEQGKKDKHGQHGTVYVLTNSGTTFQEDLERINFLRDMGYRPFVMIFDKPNAPKELWRLQRWANNPWIANSCLQFSDYREGRRAI